MKEKRFLFSRFSARNVLVATSRSVIDVKIFFFAINKPIQGLYCGTLNPFRFHLYGGMEFLPQTA